jgi:hypothetical protein
VGTGEKGTLYNGSSENRDSPIEDARRGAGTEDDRSARPERARRERALASGAAGRAVVARAAVQPARSTGFRAYPAHISRVNTGSGLSTVAMPRPSGPTDRDAPHPTRIWTVREANARLPELQELIPRLRAWALRLSEVHAEVHRLSEFWGSEIDAADHADHERKAQLDAEWKHLTNRLEEAVSSLQRDGIEVKDLESGLVDFYGMVDREVVFLCWRHGETEVASYHTLTGGFRSRRPLPAELRAPVPKARDLA